MLARLVKVAGVERGLGGDEGRLRGVERARLLRDDLLGRCRDLLRVAGALRLGHRQEERGGLLVLALLPEMPSLPARRPLESSSSS